MRCSLAAGRGIQATTQAEGAGSSSKACSVDTEPRELEKEGEGSCGKTSPKLKRRCAELDRWERFLALGTEMLAVVREHVEELKVEEVPAKRRKIGSGGGKGNTRARAGKY